MTLDNLLEYGKIGLGTWLTSIVISHDLGTNNARQAAQEAMYRTLEVVNPETIMNAYKQFNNYSLNNPSNPTSFGLGLIYVVGGAGMLASGIYNLAKNYKKETKE